MSESKLLAALAMSAAMPVSAGGPWTAFSTSSSRAITTNSFRCQPGGVIQINGPSIDQSPWLVVDSASWRTCMWSQPASAASVSVSLTTRDGKHWRAKWEQVK